MLKTLMPWVVIAAKIALPVMIVIEVYLSLISLGGGPRFAHADKLAHFIMHAANVSVAAVAFPAIQRFKHVLIFLLCLGPIIEILQHFSPPREASILDECANLAGSLVAYWVAMRWLRPFVQSYADTDPA